MFEEISIYLVKESQAWRKIDKDVLLEEKKNKVYFSMFVKEILLFSRKFMLEIEKILNKVRISKYIL